MLLPPPPEVFAHLEWVHSDFGREPSSKARTNDSISASVTVAPFSRGLVVSGQWLRISVRRGLICSSFPAEGALPHN